MCRRLQQKYSFRIVNIYYVPGTGQAALYTQDIFNNIVKWVKLLSRVRLFETP